jgi:hypothetical protein
VILYTDNLNTSQGVTNGVTLQKLMLVEIIHFNQMTALELIRITLIKHIWKFIAKSDPYKLMLISTVAYVRLRNVPE